MDAGAAEVVAANFRDEAVAQVEKLRPPVLMTCADREPPQ